MKQGHVVIGRVGGQITRKILDINNHCLRAVNPNWTPPPPLGEREANCFEEHLTTMPSAQ